jgi:hypothetical protein
MADQKEQPTEKCLTDFKGTPTEQRAAKSAFISKWGYEAFEQIVRNSARDVQR